MKIVAVVSDRHTKEPVPYAPVWLGETLGVTNERGEAILDIPEGKQRLKVRASNYEPLDRDIEVTHPIKFRISLRSEEL